MARVARTARRHIEQLIDHFLKHDRAEAAQRLRSAVDEALRRADGGQTPARFYPANYSELSVLGMQWLKVHIYWFGYGTASDGQRAIANVLWEGADIPSRVEPFDGTT